MVYVFNWSLGGQSGMFLVFNWSLDGTTQWFMFLIGVWVVKWFMFLIWSLGGQVV